MNAATLPIEVGTVLPDLTLPPISRTTLALFAGASGDHNPIHIDPDFAQAAGFDDVFAHGMLSMAYLGRLLTSWLPQAQLRAWSTRFVSVLPLHGQPTCRGRVTSATSTCATVELTVSLADGTVTVVGDAVVALT